MQPQCITTAISTDDLLSSLEICACADEPKHTFRDLMGSVAQLATAVSLCWVVTLVG